MPTTRRPHPTDPPRKRREPAWMPAIEAVQAAIRANGVVLEEMGSHMRAGLEALQAQGERHDRAIADLRAELVARIEVVESVVRQNSRDIQKNSEDIRKNSEDIRKNSEDIQRLSAEVRTLREEVGGLADKVSLRALEARVTALELRAGTRG